MTRHAYLAGCAMASLLMLGAFTDALAFDERALQRQGDVYVVALREGYLSHAAKAIEAGDQDRAQFFEARAANVEAKVARNAFDIAPLHPVAMETNDSYRRDVLLDAYEETATTVDSEAADADPERVARLQIDYEQWLYDAHRGEDDKRFAQGWDQWENALDALVDDSPNPGEDNGQPKDGPRNSGSS